MTPQRKQYLAKCGGREKKLRHLINCFKLELRKAKAVCSSYNLKALGRKPFGYRLHIVTVNEIKVILKALYHELARLKGMDRVVVPKMFKFVFSDGCKFEHFVCPCCAETLATARNYCPNCGRRILWEKVK